MILLVASNVALLLVLVALAVMTLSIARQVGILHARTVPAGFAVTASVVQEGDVLDDIAQYFSGRSFERPLAVCLFVSLRCPLCRTLHRALQNLADQYDVHALWVIVHRPGEDVRKYIADEGLAAADVIASPELAVKLNVMQTPALVGFAADGRLLGTELVSRRAELEKLIRRWLGNDKERKK